MSYLYKQSLILLSSLLLCCCATTKNEKNNSTENYSVDVLIYGLLQKSNGNYRFAAYQTKLPDKDMPWVNLSTGHPIWDTSKKIDCGTGALLDGLHGSNCKNISKTREDLFYEKKVNKSSTAFSIIITGGAGGVHNQIQFNDDKFKKAYNKAFERIDRNTISEIIKEIKYIEEKYYKYQINYDSKLISSSGLPDIKIITKDDSGFFENQIDFREKINVQKNHLPKIDVSSTNINDFLMVLRNEKISLFNQWEKLTGEVNVKCVSSSKAFVFKLKCPPIFKFENNQLTGTVHATVESQRFPRLLPKKLILQDKNIELIFDGTNIGLTNKTNNFVKIGNISFYYKTKIASKSFNIELSPKSSLVASNRPRIKYFPIEWSHLDFKGVTKAKAMKEYVKYGFAVKYNIVDTNKDKSLFSEKVFLLKDLI